MTEDLSIAMSLIKQKAKSLNRSKQKNLVKKASMSPQPSVAKIVFRVSLCMVFTENRTMNKPDIFTLLRIGHFHVALKRAPMSIDSKPLNH
jgi:hypothetical protein